MKSPTCFIVSPDKAGRYRNKEKVGDVELITSTDIEDHKAVNRIAEIVEVPVGYDGPIERGDRMLVHHNVFRIYFDMSGQHRSSGSFVKEQVFMVDPSQYYAYDKGDGWVPIDGYCFVRPVAAEGGALGKFTGHQPLTGIMVYPDRVVKGMGVGAGDKVTFTPHSEYEFNVDGDILYRVMSSQITAQL